MKAALFAMLVVFVASSAAADQRRSGFETMSPALQAMQKDDATNPAMLWVGEGKSLWATWACAKCHAESSMQGAATRYPAFDAKLQRALTLSQRIQQCRPGLATEGDELLSITAYVALQSRGMPIAPPDDARLQADRARGQALFERRIGQLNLSCAQCHDQRSGGKLAGALIPQGHPTGYPLYRLEWQGLGSLPRRMRNCASGVRAQPWEWDSRELVDLELYLMQRAAGLPMDGPAVRP